VGRGSRFGDLHLEDFDAEVVAQYRITRQDLQDVVRYVTHLQGSDSLTLEVSVLTPGIGQEDVNHENSVLDYAEVLC